MRKLLLGCILIAATKTNAQVLEMSTIQAPEIIEIVVVEKKKTYRWFSKKDIAPLALCVGAGYLQGTRDHVLYHLS